MTNLPSLPSEILLQVLSFLRAPGPDPFWTRGVTARTLFPSSISVDKKSRATQIEAAKNLALVCRRLRPVSMSVVWAQFECNSTIQLRNLRNICEEEHGVGSYVRELDFQLPSLPLDMIEAQLATIWPRLDSLHTLTLTLTPTYGCPAWLVTQLRTVAALRTLRLRVFGNSLGSHLRALSSLSDLYIEIYPPDASDRDTEVLGEGPVADSSPIAEVSREAYHSWATLFNDFVGLVESCTNVSRMGWFVHWTMVHAFYRHAGPAGGVPNYSDPMLVKHIRHLPPNLTSLSVALESQMGTISFLRALSSLPITDLALVSYDHALLFGSSFKEFCQAFKGLRRLRLKLRNPSIAVGGEHGRFLMDEESFIEGLASLPHLKAYKGPILIKRPTISSAPNPNSPGRPFSLEVKSALTKLVHRLRERGVQPDTLVQWSVWLDGVYGPKEFYILPPDGPRRLDGKGSVDFIAAYSHGMRIWDPQ